ncbi:hypothetical protein HPB47_024480 [Ixodes persulcatus]|uniref:Uncharacterized protein n=1 Tax=Ixodes persulcatus TaxID=34615 RepID=A0AC60Q4H9_IXOPE|nr:hypothetical protein HPB47_024480 [Ixodes persulcatus]
MVRLSVYADKHHQSFAPINIIHHVEMREFPGTGCSCYAMGAAWSPGRDFVRVTGCAASPLCLAAREVSARVLSRHVAGHVSSCWRRYSGSEGKRRPVNHQVAGPNLGRGFGSMLRAIGAQIEKTTNREACRDLSGRRLRDINHETRLKRWVARQAEAQRERRRPLEAPRHTLDDPEFQRQRDLLPDRVQEAVSHGLTVGGKRPKTGGGPPKKRRAPLWLGAPEMPSSEDSAEEEESGGEGESREQGEETDLETLCGSTLRRLGRVSSRDLVRGVSMTRDTGLRVADVSEREHALEWSLLEGTSPLAPSSHGRRGRRL